MSEANYLLRAANQYLSKGEIDKCRSLCLHIIKEYPNTVFSKESEGMLALIENSDALSESLAIKPVDQLTNGTNDQNISKNNQKNKFPKLTKIAEAFDVLSVIGLMLAFVTSYGSYIYIDGMSDGMAKFVISGSVFFFHITSSLVLGLISEMIKLSLEIEKNTRKV